MNLDQENNLSPNERQALEKARRQNARNVQTRNNGLDALSQKMNKHLQDSVEASQEVDVDNSREEPSDEEHLVEGPIFKWLDEGIEDARWNSLIGFTKEVYLSLWRSLAPLIGRPKGKKPSISYPEALLCYLMWQRTGLSFENLSATLSYSSSTFRDAIERIRPLLAKCLGIRWNPNNFRPQPLVGVPITYENVALCIDSTSLMVHRPKTSFNEAKVYFDGKNHIYALKVEVGVLAHSPHYGIFMSKGFVGSQHDYEIHKTGYQRYVTWLAKTAEEATKLVDGNVGSWKVVGDKAYTGPANDTPGVVRVVPKKNPSTLVEKNTNKAISKVRIPVEHFFGRQVQHFKLWEKAYPLDHKHFDMDYQISCHLTNETIRVRSLEVLDLKCYLAEIDRRIAAADARHEKKQQNYAIWGANKKRRIEDAHRQAANQVYGRE